MTGSLHEREQELGAIATALDGAVAGSGSAIVLEGPAGIGKTSVLDEARRAAIERGMAVAAARGSELETSYAWGVARQLLEPRLRGMSGPARERALSGAAALAGPIVLPETAGGDAEPTFGILHGLYWLVAGLAEERPQLLVVDDLHWADAASARFFGFLANRLDAVPVLLLAARRPRTADAAPPLRAEPIELAPLSPDATAAVLTGRYGAPVGAAFATACHTATGGNPLLVRRLADGLRDRGAGSGDDAVAAIARDGPYVVARAVGETLARLGAGPAELARAAAVLDVAPLALAARLARVEQRAAASDCEQLVRAGVLRDGRPLEFQHALVRVAVLSGMTAGERGRLHAEAARVLAGAGAAPDAVAVHLLHAEPAGDAAVAAALAAAGRRALAAGAPAEAAVALARALDEPAAAGERSRLLLDLARAEGELGWSAAAEHARAAHAEATDAIDRAEAALALLWAGGPGQDAETAMALLEQARAGVAGRDRELELRLEAARFMAAFIAGPELLRAVLGEDERYADVAGRTPGEAQALLPVAVRRFLLGRSAADVADPLKRAVAEPAVVTSIGPESNWLWMVLGALYKTDRLDLARRTAELALEHGRRNGSAPGFAAASIWRAWIALRAGSADAAEADARAAYDALPREDWRHAFCAACVIDVLVERGGLDEAFALLAASGGDGELPGDRASELLLSTRSALRAAAGDLEGALADHLETRRRRGGDLIPDPDFDGWLRVARLRHALGDTAAAAAEAGAALAWAREWGTPGYIGQALCASGSIRGGTEGLAELEDAVASLARSPARREQARSLVEYGAALRRSGERIAAREPLRRALDIATAGGLVATAELARAELRVTGARIRRRASSGPDALTPSERRIAGLAAGGATNPEIAQALFVTVKTVEMHLGNAYRKLGIGSRRELAAALGEAKEQGAITGVSP